MPALPPDWNDLRDILLIAATGSLSAAARKAGISQSTMSRRLAAIEAGGQPVFLRDETGRMTPNDRGKIMVQAARDMAAVYDRLLPVLADVQPPLRVLACTTTARLFLDEAMAEWLAQSGGITEYASEDDLLSVDPRSYDVLVTLMGSVPERSAGVQIGRVDWALYASDAYIAARPWLGSLDGHSVLRAAGSLATVDAYRWLAREGGSVAMLAANPASMAQMAAKGVAVALLPQPLGDANAGLTAILRNPCAATDVWMVADAQVALTPAVSGFFRWARGRFRPHALKRTA
jgi:DNA-binding transcriptional LysR family regulator